MPEEVKRPASQPQRSTNITMMAAFNSVDGRYDDIYLSNYVALHIKDVLARVPGVGGADHGRQKLWDADLAGSGQIASVN